MTRSCRESSSWKASPQPFSLSMPPDSSSENNQSHESSENSFPKHSQSYGNSENSLPQLLTHWSLGDLDFFLKIQISFLLYLYLSSDLLMIISSDECPSVDKSTLVQVMAWCYQATGHYLSQCWPRYMSPYGVTRPQWVKSQDSSENRLPCKSPIKLQLFPPIANHISYGSNHVTVLKFYHSKRSRVSTHWGQ